eukprot:4283484-Prymnesium_polylepis.1
MVELLSWQTLPDDAKVYVYVPYAPAVGEKYGLDASGLPRCSGPMPPEGLDEATEASGKALQPPSVAYPILQCACRALKRCRVGPSHSVHGHHGIELAQKPTFPARLCRRTYIDV